MNDISDFIQSYWFELASLTAQFAILAVLVWYARARLRMFAATECEVKPAPKPADASTVVVRLDPKLEPEAQPVRPASLGRSSWPVPERSMSSVAQPSIASTAHAIMESPGAAQVAAPPKPKRSGPGPMRAIVNWLRAPVHTRARKPRRVAAAPESIATAPQHVMAPALAMSMVPPAEAEAYAAGHGGVGRMLSPVPEAVAQQSEAVIHRPVKRNGPIRGFINWLRAPMYSRPVPRPAVRQ
jgi:hypothetical protein